MHAVPDAHRARADLPLICPHGHIDAVRAQSPPLLHPMPPPYAPLCISQAIFADPAFRFSDPAALFITPDHYVYRMLASQGIALEALGVPGPDGAPVAPPPPPREVWRTFAANYHLFRGTPVRATAAWAFCI